MDALWDQSGSKAVLLRECVWTLVSAKQNQPSQKRTRTDIDPMGAGARECQLGEVKAGLQQTASGLLLLWQCRMARDYCSY